MQYAHRAVYEMEVGPIADGLEIDHLCRNRGCVNPAHLEPVTHKENVLRGATVPGLNAVKTHCLRGHEFDEENTRHIARNGRRVCRACMRERCREYYALNREAVQARRRARRAGLVPTA
jgi:hypothetical protein